MQAFFALFFQGLPRRHPPGSAPLTALPPACPDGRAHYLLAGEEQKRRQNYTSGVGARRLLAVRRTAGGAAPAAKFLTSLPYRRSGAAENCPIVNEKKRKAAQR